MPSSLAEVIDNPGAEWGPVQGEVTVQQWVLTSGIVPGCWHGARMLRAFFCLPTRLFGPLVLPHAPQSPPLGPRDYTPLLHLHSGPRGPETLSVGPEANRNDLTLFLR